MLQILRYNSSASISFHFSADEIANFSIAKLFGFFLVHERVPAQAVASSIKPNNNNNVKK